MKKFEAILAAMPILSEDKIHVFLIQFSQFDSGELIQYLSDTERARAEKLKIEQKKDQFVITRSLLRRLLSTCTKKETDEITFFYEEHGKPFIKETLNNEPIEFNISHSGDYGLIAITLNQKVGVDIEEINLDIGYEALSTRFFSEKEKNELLSLSQNKHHDAFYRIWARKESFIKAIGKGVAYGLERFSVSLREESVEGIPILTPEVTEGKWFNYNLMHIDNYKTALTSSAKNSNIVIYQ